MISKHSRLKDVSPEIVYSDGGFFAADDRVISQLKDRARLAPRRRCRLCFHVNENALQQEMLIVMQRCSYVRPHRHVGKVETLTVVEGQCDALIFDGAGQVSEVIRMSPAFEGGSFFYRMPPGIFHTLIFHSEWLVFLETTLGPFDRARTEQADWAPSEIDSDAGHAYLSKLSLPTP
jgi:cupin fold WbuC family metalloprotein